MLIPTYFTRRHWTGIALSIWGRRPAQRMKLSSHHKESSPWAPS